MKGNIMNIDAIVDTISGMELNEKIDTLNQIREKLHSISPFASEPVDFVKWVKAPMVHANDYNPNSVAPPEMELLRLSIDADGYTQPIVSMPDPDGKFEVIDGFHRHRVGKECISIQSRIHGYLPLVQIRESQYDKTNRMASTIRHNRARGKHNVTAMSDIVIELKRRNWSDDRIARELGMDADEVLRLCQITGLATTFKDHAFSEAWEAEKVTGGDEELISDIIADYKPKNISRIFHTYEKWECYKHGFYSERPPKGMSQEDGELAYKTFLSDLTKFEEALNVVINEWVYSCEHYLTNDRMNRIAWLGQASVAQALNIPSICRGGYSRMTSTERQCADELALIYLNKWLVKTNRQSVTMELAGGKTEMDLY
jgi:hypothetical protein